MAFDLNKNGESKPKVDLSKKSGSKFNLTKEGEPTKVEAAAEEPKKPNGNKKILIAVAAVAIIGLIIWGVSTKSSDKNKVASTSGIVADTTNAAKQQPSDSVATANVNTQPETATETKPTAENSSVSTEPTAKRKDVASDKKTKPADVATKSALNNKVAASFDQSSSSLKKLDKAVVKDILAYLEQNPKATVVLNGYASSEGLLEVNQRISQTRANAMKEYLITQGVAESRVNAIGKGIENPVASNDTEEGRIKNRRVEISLQ